MTEDLTAIEVEEAVKLFIEIDRFFLNYDVESAATSELARHIPDDEEAESVYRFLEVTRWQCLREREPPPDGTLLPCLCPSIALASFLPLFMWIALRDVVIRNVDRIFLDSLLNRLVCDATVEPDRLKRKWNDQQITCLKTFLGYVTKVCFQGDHHDSTLIGIQKMAAEL